jgi:hypothetical protein
VAYREPKTNELTAVQELALLESGDEEALARITVDAAKSARDGYTLKLYEPIMVGPNAVSELKFRPQTLADIRKSPTDLDLTAMLCGIESAQVEQLSSLDWKATQAVLQGFHLRRAAGGGSTRKA